MTEDHSAMHDLAAPAVVKIVLSWALVGLAYFFNHATAFAASVAFVLNLVILAHMLWRWRREAREPVRFRRDPADE